MAAFMTGISIDSLPKTFQHAVAVTKWFQIRYLWIDSLCIVQDSVQDWERECTRMKGVYQNAWCNIAATAASDSRSGLFFDRDPALVPMGRMYVGLDGFLKGEYYFFEDQIWKGGVAYAPLNRRAWVVQERLLARRVLHFGLHSLFFECSHLEACETFPDGIPSYAATGLNRFKDIYTCEEGLWRSPYEKWRRVVAAFMRGDLSVGSDKVVSLSGIAEEFRQEIIKETYFAGFWENNLAEQLLWSVPKGQQANGRPSKRPAQYRAPSWSFLSIDGDVALSNPLTSPAIIEIKHISVDLVDGNHLTGPMKGGCVIVRGLLKAATWGTDSSMEDLTQNGDYLVFDGQNADGTMVFFDEAATKPTRDETIFCLLVGFQRYAEGLIMLPTGREEGEYCRIGLFIAEGEENLGMLVAANESEKVTLTIV